jgi:hypothetical protein
LFKITLTAKLWAMLNKRLLREKRLIGERNN